MQFTMICLFVFALFAIFTPILTASYEPAEDADRIKLNAREHAKHYKQLSSDLSFNEERLKGLSAMTQQALDMTLDIVAFSNEHLNSDVELRIKAKTGRTPAEQAEVLRAQLHTLDSQAKHCGKLKEKYAQTAKGFEVIEL